MVSGPGAGSIYWLSAGYADIGSGPVEVCLWDKAAAPSALRVFVDGRGGCQVASFEGVEAALDREPLTAAAQWRPGQLIAVGIFTFFAFSCFQNVGILSGAPGLDLRALAFLTAAAIWASV